MTNDTTSWNKINIKYYQTVIIFNSCDCKGVKPTLARLYLSCSKYGSRFDFQENKYNRVTVFTVAPKHLQSVFSISVTRE